MLSTSSILPIHSSLDTTSIPRHVLGSALPSAWNQAKSFSKERRTARPYASADVDTRQGLRHLGANALLEGSVASPRLGQGADALESGPGTNLWGAPNFKTHPLRLDTGIENRHGPDFVPVPRTGSTSSAASSVFAPHDRGVTGQFDFASLGRQNTTSQDVQLKIPTTLPPSASYTSTSAGRASTSSSGYQSNSFGIGQIMADGANGWNSTVHASPLQAFQNASVTGLQHSSPATYSSQPANWALPRDDTPLSGIESNARWHGPFAGGMQGLRLPMSLPQSRPSADDNTQAQLHDTLSALTLSSGRAFGWDDAGRAYRNETMLLNGQPFSPPPSRHYSYDAKSRGLGSMPSTHLGSFIPSDYENNHLLDKNFSPDSAVSLRRSTGFTPSPSSIGYTHSEQTSAGAELTPSSDWPSQIYSTGNRAGFQRYDDEKTWAPPVVNQTALLRRDNIGVGSAHMLPPHLYGTDPLAPQYPYAYQMTPTQEGAGIRSRLLEEFKTKSRASRRWELRVSLCSHLD